MSDSKSSLIWFNGENVPQEKATVSVLSHGLHYGTSVFEGIRAYKTDKGTAVFRLQDHVQRLFDSAKIYRLQQPYTKEQVEEAIRDNVRVNGFDSAYIRPLIFAGNVGLGVGSAQGKNCEVIVASMQWGAYLGEEALEQGIDVCVSSWSRVAPNTLPTGAKAGGNYLSSQLINEESHRHGYAEGLALDVNGLLSEGSGENVFLVKKGKLYTPPLSACILPGITRDTIAHLANRLGIEVVEQNIAREALYLADEVFMCGTAAEITPVRSVDGQQVGIGKCGPVTKQLQQAFFGLFNGETEDTEGWLDYIN
ncbi:branched-chain amino acid transaminase [Celerinatantimonas sp. MCCC 1A17872]|uniref:branched-chain amino acid transaminase n=1 Tax=Celerinatantimonas sp. MCCC 1A17872 TaxID=3177514 RepID=UPI0038BEDEDD